MRARRPQLLLGALLCALLVLPAGEASARKVGNPGTFTASLPSGTFRIKGDSFDLGTLSPDPTMTGTVAANGALNFPTGGVSFPSLPFDSGDGIVQVTIIPTHDWTGTLNPITGDMSLRMRFRLKLTGEVGPFNTDLGQNCTIGSSGSPIDLNTAITGTTNPPGPNDPITGTKYNPSGGAVTIVNNSFSIPGAGGCPSILGQSVNDIVNDSLGLPSSAGNNEGRLSFNFSPDATKGVNASFTVSPATGTTPFLSNFNAGASTCTAPCTYNWDFDGNGTTDHSSSSPTTSFTYATPGSYDPKLRVVDLDGDADETTRDVTANAPPPDLSINKSHVGNFLAGTQESYTIAVSNVGLGATQGTTTVTDTLNASYSFISGTGSGWTCGAVLQVVTCTRTSLIGAGASAPNITLNVNVAGNAPASITNTAAVSTVAGTSPETVLGNNSDGDPTTIDRIDMAITKTDNGQTFETGTVETYDLNLANQGNVATSGTTTVTDTLPTGISFNAVRAPAGWSCGTVGQTVTCTRTSAIAPGSAGTIEIDVVAGSTAATPDTTNTASVSTPNDADPSDNSDSESTPIQHTVDLTIEKTNGSAFRVGSAASYTLAVQNRGAKTATALATVTDVLPAGLVPTTATGSTWSCNVVTQTVTCTSNEDLEANENAGLITVNVDVTPSVARPTVTNTAAVATAGVGADLDVNLANNTDSVDTTITVTDLTIDKSHVGGFPLGGQGEYTLSVRNDGTAPTVGTTTVTDTLPAELSYVNASGPGWSCGAVGQAVTCTRTTSIDAGQTAPPIELSVDVADTDAVETINSASVSAADDVNAANDSDTDPTPLTAADLAITKSHTGNFRVGTDRAYVLRVENVGSQPTEGITTVTDTLPSGLAYEGATGSGWTCGAVLQLVTCTRTNDVAPGANAPAITVQVQVNPAAFPAVTNNAAVTNLEDRNDANDTAADPTTVTASDLELEKSHQGTVQVNAQATYLIKVTNIGTADTNSPTTVTDTLPAGLTFAGTPSQDWSCSNVLQVVTCENSGSIAAGDTTGTTLELRANVAPTAANQVTNTATVASANDPNSANDSDNDIADVARIDLSIDKSHTGDFTRGTPGIYVLEVENEGSGPTLGVTRVTDVLPAGLSYSDASGDDWSCSVSSGTVECTHADPIGAGETADPIDLDVDVSPSAAPLVTNTASVSTAGDSDLTDNSDADPTTTLAASDIAGSIRAQVPAGPTGFFRVGRNGTYNVAVRNAGASALTGGLTAVVDLPAGLAYEGFSGAGWTCAASSEGASCSHTGDLAPESRSDIALEVAVEKQALPGATTGLTVANAADPSGANNTDTDFTPVKMIDLAIAMQHAGTFALGTPSTFTINVENVGSTATLAATRVVDFLPAGLTFSGSSGAGWNCVSTAPLVICMHQGILGPGDQAEPLTLSVTPQSSAASRTLVNTANVAGEDDGDAVNNSATDQVTIGAAPAVLPAQQVAGKVCKKKKGKKKKCKKRKK